MVISEKLGRSRFRDFVGLSKVHKKACKCNVIVSSILGVPKVIVSFTYCPPLLVQTCTYSSARALEFKISQFIW